MYKIAIFVPESHINDVKQALFEADAGRIGHYDQCCWQVKGQGQFRALDEANPYLGEKGKVEFVNEYNEKRTPL